MEDDIEENTDKCVYVYAWLPTFADRGCHVVSVTDPYGRILGFLDSSRYFSIKQLLSCTHEAEWTPFQTHVFFSGSHHQNTGQNYNTDI
jgi:hypothetical protein